MNCFVVGTLAQTYRLAVLDVTEPGTRPCWFDTDGHKLACLVGRVCCKGECFLKGRSICNDVIGWENSHRSCMIAQRYPAGPKRNRRCGVAFGRLGQNVLLWKIPKQLSNCAFLFCVRENQNAFRRDESFETRQSLFQQSFARDEA